MSKKKIIPKTEQKEPINQPAEPTTKEKYLALQKKREELIQKQKRNSTR
ncbi:MAG: hypothetical protein KFW21_07125 [Spirochaetota bacterium]|mgnify:CR=1 FL=1|nr:hypothetical protein [Spirochaetota bacterium]